MSSLFSFATEQLEELRKKDRLRKPAKSLTDYDKSHIVIDFATNDYFSLATHPEVIEAAKRATSEFGTSSSASRYIPGHHEGAAALEEALAKHHDHDACALMGTGYMANLAVVSTISSQDDLILADKLVHASLIDGALASKARLMRFKHNSTADIKERLDKHRRSYRHIIILTETVFSMDGDLAPLLDLAELAKTYDAWLVVDDAHGIGLNLTKLLKPYHGRTIITGTLSKALASQGGYMVGSHDVIAWLRSTMRPGIYSTALPPASIAAAHAALKILEDAPQLVSQTLALAKLFATSLEITFHGSCIIPWIVPRSSELLELSERLVEHGIIVPAIRPPTVPAGSARLRFSIHAALKESDIVKACKLLEILY